MPLEICKMARHSRIKICKDDFNTAPDKGFCASQNSWFYGYKLHGVCSISGVFQSIDITKASVHDVHLLKDLKHQLSDCVLLGDRVICLLHNNWTCLKVQILNWKHR